MRWHTFYAERQTSAVTYLFHSLQEGRAPVATVQQPLHIQAVMLQHIWVQGR